MTKPTSTGKSCFDCILNQFDISPKKDDDYKGFDSDDDSTSDYTNDESGSESDSEEDPGDMQPFERFLAAPRNVAFQRSASTTNLFTAVEGREAKFQSIMSCADNVRAQDHNAIVQTKPANVSGVDDDDDVNPVKPIDHLESILKTMGLAPEVRPYSSMVGFFYQHTPQQVDAYDNTVIGAVRRNDVEELRRLHKAGQELQCSNRFGESIVHTTARRGTADMIKFLLTETTCTVRVCCDNGRNPLHDACWTSSPNFDVVRLILEDTPNLLFIADKRNFTPLDYVPRDCWAKWCKFLDENKDLLKTSLYQ